MIPTQVSCGAIVVFYKYKIVPVNHKTVLMY